jgi:hypothetical protein
LQDWALPDPLNPTRRAENKRQGKEEMKIMKEERDKES